MGRGKKILHNIKFTFEVIDAFFIQDKYFESNRGFRDDRFLVDKNPIVKYIWFAIEITSVYKNKSIDQKVVGYDYKSFIFMTETDWN